MRRCATTLEAEMTREEQALLLRAVRRCHPSTCLEIGTAAGGSLCAMLQAFSSEERPRFVVVDTMKYFPNQKEIVERNLRQQRLDSAAIDFRVGRSEDIFPAANAAGDTFDFVIIDGSHKIRAVTADLKWCRLLNAGGIVCFHDFSSRHLGVWLAVRLFLLRHHNYTSIGRAGSLIVLRKTAASTRLEIGRMEEFLARSLDRPLRILDTFRRTWVARFGSASRRHAQKSALEK